MHCVMCLLLGRFGGGAYTKCMTCVDVPFVLPCLEATCLATAGQTERNKHQYVVISTPYLTLPSGWAGCYTCPALRPYQFGPMRSPDVTRRSQ